MEAPTKSSRANTTNRVVNESGTIESNGTIGLIPFSTSIALNVDDISLKPFQPYVSDQVNLVITDGKLLWVQDAYTTTNRYPYSEPYTAFGKRVNYVRNSVKVVIDAYDGDVTFYVIEPDDAMTLTYQSIFPDLFVSAEEMPESLKAHLRYPEGMFDIQAEVYRSYHMTDTRVFYTKEDLWALPKEVYSGQEQLMEPYYVIMRLPDEDMEEFLLMLPFTPVNKNNTIGWLAARCDGENYGKLLAYDFPKGNRKISGLAPISDSSFGWVVGTGYYR